MRSSVTVTVRGVSSTPGENVATSVPTHSTSVCPVAGAARPNARTVATLSARSARTRFRFQPAELCTHVMSRLLTPHLRCRHTAGTVGHAMRERCSVTSDAADRRRPCGSVHGVEVPHDVEHRVSVRVATRSRRPGFVRTSRRAAGGRGRARARAACVRCGARAAAGATRRRHGRPVEGRSADGRASGRRGR